MIDLSTLLPPTSPRVRYRYRYGQDERECSARLRHNSQFIVALAVSRFPVPSIGAVFGVTAECINQRLRKVHLTKRSGRPVMAHSR